MFVNPLLLLFVYCYVCAARAARKIHAVDEPSWYLMKLVHEIGLESRASASCAGVRRIRYGHFELGHALLLKHCTAPQAILDNIALCRPLVTHDRLRRTAQIECGRVAVVEGVGLIEKGGGRRRILMC